MHRLFIPLRSTRSWGYFLCMLVCRECVNMEKSIMKVSTYYYVVLEVCSRKCNVAISHRLVTTWAYCGSHADIHAVLCQVGNKDTHIHTPVCFPPCYLGLNRKSMFRYQVWKYAILLPLMLTSSPNQPTGFCLVARIVIAARNVQALAPTLSLHFLKRCWALWSTPPPVAGTGWLLCTGGYVKTTRTNQ